MSLLAAASSSSGINLWAALILGVAAVAFVIDWVGTKSWRAAGAAFLAVGIVAVVFFAGQEPLLAP